MIKRIIDETVIEYDTNGKIKSKTITHTEEDDDTTLVPYYPTIPPYPIHYDQVTYGSDGRSTTAGPSDFTIEY